MKKKSFKNKLTLNKNVISNLQNYDMINIKGGSIAESNCCYSDEQGFCDYTDKSRCNTNCVNECNDEGLE